MNTVEELKAEIESLKSVIRKNNETIQSLQKLNSWYEEQLKLRAKEKFGRSSEKACDGQISLFDLFNEAEALREPIAKEPDESIIIAEHKRKKSKRGKKLESLPVEVKEYKLDDDELICDVCGETLTVMKKEVRKELVVIPAEIKVVEHVTYLYSCRNCDRNGEAGYIKKAPHPKALIPKSFVSPSLMAYIMNQKYTLALPLYRQEQEFKRLGIELSRQNLSNWIIKGAELLKPLYNELISNLMKEELLHADETVLEVLNEPGRPATAKSYVWIYRTSLYNKHPVMVYEYTSGRNGAYAQTFLKNWQGKYLHCDGYSGYKKLDGITLCGCLVHAKRKFHEALVANRENEYARQGEEYIRKLFAIEKEADKKGLSFEERLELRTEKSKAVTDSFYNWISDIESEILPQSLMGKAITYALKQKEYLCSFLLDGRIQLSNNLAEQSIKPFVIGRSNWLFSNTPNGADASTLIYSIIQTAIANELIPQKYLEFLFESIISGMDVSTLVPWSEEIPDKCRKRKIQA